MKKLIAIPAVGMGVLAAGGIAWAALGGFVNVPDVIQGAATGQGASSCQTSALTFTLPEPTWDAATTDYVVTSISYSGISTPCVNLATVDLELRIVSGSQTLATATEANLSSSSGSMSLTPAVSFDTAANAEFVYLVKG